ncbi:MAG TPA: ABC transporter substrate-binding protein, partial [Chloroflexota bacterium]|nr:ABC transporter substrate-binding protein [Chloroflexota bacterium]
MVGAKLWRLPFNIDVNFPLFVNKKAFRAAGLNADRTPTTIAQLDEATKLTRGAGGAHDQFGFVPWQFYGHTNPFQSRAYTFSGEFWDPAKDKV